MIEYYAEYSVSSHKQKFNSDNEAIEYFKKFITNQKLLAVYKESDTLNGKPFIIVFEKDGVLVKWLTT